MQLVSTIKRFRNTFLPIFSVVGDKVAIYKEVNFTFARGVMNRRENVLCGTHYVKNLELSGPLHLYSRTLSTNDHWRHGDGVDRRPSLIMLNELKQVQVTSLSLDDYCTVGCHRALALNIFSLVIVICYSKWHSRAR